jgi:CRISPR-associated protein Cas2
MYVIAVYDVDQKRVVKMLKLCRRYLNWIQNSVFEGEITDLGLKELIYEARQVMDEREDSFIIFSSREERWLTKTIVGKERSEVDNIL